MSERLIFALPSKGRIMEDTIATLAASGLEVRRVGHARGYRGEIVGLPNVEVAFVSATEIAEQIKWGRAHLGVTGEDLLTELMLDARRRVNFLKPLGFGHADVVVAVPAAWLDVTNMADLQRAARSFRQVHGRHMRVATKFRNLTRRHFAEKGVTSYQTVESLGATEGAPAAGTAELIVDLTSTGETIRANNLKIIDTILKSQVHLVASTAAPWTPSAREAENIILRRLGL